MNLYMCVFYGVMVTLLYSVPPLQVDSNDELSLKKKSEFSMSEHIRIVNSLHIYITNTLCVTYFMLVNDICVCSLRE